MPIYEYRCETCDHELEALQKIADAPLTDCPACGQPALKKKISAVGFRLKGRGWYETDFKARDKQKNIVKDESCAAKDKNEKSSNKSSSEKSDGGSKSEKATSNTEKSAKSGAGKAAAA